MKKIVILIFLSLIVIPKAGHSLVLSIEPTAIAQALAEVKQLIGIKKTAEGKAGVENDKLSKMGSLKSSLSDITKKAKELKEKKEALQAQYQEAKAEYDKKKAEFDKHMNKVKDGINEAKDQVDEAKDKADEVKDKIDEAKDQVDEAKDKVDEAKDKEQNEDEDLSASPENEIAEEEDALGSQYRKEFMSADEKDAGADEDKPDTIAGDVDKVVSADEKDAVADKDKPDMIAGDVDKVVSADEKDAGADEDKLDMIAGDVDKVVSADEKDAGADEDKPDMIAGDVDKVVSADEKSFADKREEQREKILNGEEPIRAVAPERPDSIKDTIVSRKPVARKSFEKDIKPIKAQKSVVNSLKEEAVEAPKEKSAEERVIDTEKRLNDINDVGTLQKTKQMFRKVFKVSSGYGSVSQTYSFGFAQGSAKTNQMENGSMVLPAQMEIFCGYAGYEESAKKGALKDCLLKHKKALSATTEDGEVNENYSLALKKIAERNLANGMAEYYAAAFWEGLKIQNDSTRFRKDRIDHQAALYSDDVDNAWAAAREANEELNRQFAITQSMLSRRMLNKIFAKYLADMGIK